MQRESFLAELRGALADRLPAAEMDEVLSDYDEFFATGVADGESEEQVAARLGDPARIAESLLGGQAAADLQPAEKIVMVQKAPVYKRLLAIAIDSLLAALPFLWLSPRLAVIGFFVPQYVPTFLTSFISTVRISSHSWIAAARPFWLAAIVLAGVWFFLLNPVCLIIFHGQTIGKRLIGIRVVTASGEPANAAQCIARELFGKLGVNTLFGLIWLPLAFLPAIVSLTFSIVTPAGLTVWDAIAGTRVSDAPARGEEA